MSEIWTPGASASGFDPAGLSRRLDDYLSRCEQELIGIRRDLHAHPEVAFQEYRTTGVIVDFLTAAGLQPWVLPDGTGVICDIPGGDGPMIALRADIDALPQHDTKDVPYRSTVPGVAHNCGHDVHTTMVMGAGRFLALLAEAGLLPGTVRLIFQPGEEVPGGAWNVLGAGGLDGVERIFALHCDPSKEVGFLGLKTGAITSSYAKVLIRLTGGGGHTARPFETEDMITALGKTATELPAVLARRIDPRSPHVLCWGRIAAGQTANAIPIVGELEGTLRCADPLVRQWILAELPTLLAALTSLYGVEGELTFPVDMPATVNEATSVEIFRTAGRHALGDGKIIDTDQSLGSEDFSLYAERIPAAYARLGVRTPGTPMVGIHHSGFDVDESIIALGGELLVYTALTALDRSRSGV